jgi:hypothetical protein
MKTWIEHIEEQHSMEAQQRAARDVEKLETFRLRMTPVVERLRRFLATVPESERYPRPITFFSEALRPRHHGRFASQREVADALRALGFTRHRGWQKAEQGFRSLWYFPINITKEINHG